MPYAASWIHHLWPTQSHHPGHNIPDCHVQQASAGMEIQVKVRLAVKLADS
jgi:hypothetical protein